MPSSPLWRCQMEHQVNDQIRIPATPPRLSVHTLPPYSYIPKLFPHSIRETMKHIHGQADVPIHVGDTDAVMDLHHWAVDLFNHGYYWEAHEAWETLWHAFGRKGPQADFFKGLIKLAAVGVKAREGSQVGVERHARRAAELFRISDHEPGFQDRSTFGLSATWLIAQSHRLLAMSDLILDSSACSVKRVMPFVLELSNTRP